MARRTRCGDGEIADHVPVGSLDLKTRVAERIVAAHQPAA